MLFMPGGDSCPLGSSSWAAAAAAAPNRDVLALQI